MHQAPAQRRAVKPGEVVSPKVEREGHVWRIRSLEAARQDLPGRARELIGREPDITEEFDIEATIEGRFDIDELSRLGLAFEG